MNENKKVPTDLYKVTITAEEISVTVYIRCEHILEAQNLAFDKVWNEYPQCAEREFIGINIQQVPNSYEE